MGALKDMKKTNSEFLLIDKGGYAIVRYEGFQIGPDPRKPSKQRATYSMIENGLKRYWNNASGKVCDFMDEMKPGTWLKISRTPWINMDGTEDQTKSIYVVERVNVDREGRVTLAAQPSQVKITQEPEMAQQTPPVAWDENQ